MKLKGKKKKWIKYLSSKNSLFKDTINHLQLFILTNAIRCFRLPL